MTGRRVCLAALALTWPAGLVLTAANMEVAEVTLPIFILLDVLYAGLVGALLWRFRDVLDRWVVALVGAGVGVFVVVAWAGPPTAAAPGPMMVNTAVLLGVALLLLVVTTSMVVARRDSPSVAGVFPGLALLLLGTTLYVGNLVARLAVVFSGAAAEQAEVEATAWMASEYLRGLDPAPEYLAYLLTWFDLLQLGYVVTVYVAFAGLARLLQAHNEISARAGRGIEVSAVMLSAAVVLGVGLAAALPRELDAVPAWAAFVASIPFMTTLLPFGLGIALLGHRAHSSTRVEMAGVARGAGVGPTG